MKTIETPLTAILTVLFLVFTTNNYVKQIKLDEEKAEKAIQDCCFTTYRRMLIFPIIVF